MKKLLKEWKKFLNVLEEQQGMAPPPEKVDFKNLGRPGSGVSYFKSDANREELEKINLDPNVPTYDERVEFHKANPYADWRDEQKTTEKKFESDMEQGKLGGVGMQIKPRPSMAWTGGPAKGKTPPGLTEPEETFVSDELEGPVEREKRPETATSRLQSIMRQKPESPVEKRSPRTTPRDDDPTAREEIPVEKMLKKKPREQEGGEWEKTQPKELTWTIRRGGEDKKITGSREELEGQIGDWETALSSHQSVLNNPENYINTFGEEKGQRMIDRAIEAESLIKRYLKIGRRALKQK